MHNTLTRPAVLLPPYIGDWTTSTAAHLLRRTLFGPRLDEILEAKDLGMDAAVDWILQPQEVPPPPLNHNLDSDPDVPIGRTWVNQPYTGSGRLRGQSLQGWYFENLLSPETGIREKMTLFWTNYFGMSRISDHRAQYKFLKLYQEIGVGNFRTMIQRITVEPAMLEFLNGNVNDAENPNENFARELLELFTIQKGPLAGPGDYTNYTEQDVVALARVFTGWRNRKFAYSDEDIPIESYFDEREHDAGAKKLSHRFDYIIIKDWGDLEYIKAIDIIFGKLETAKAFCRELYRFFVFYDITPKVEASVIEPLARVLQENEFEIRPVLKCLFTSEHFYHMAVRGPSIKNPYEFFGSILRPFQAYSHLDLSLVQRYEIGALHARWSRDLNMEFITPPTVAGWKAYYDAPQFYRNWISPSLLQRRFDLARRLIDPNNHINNFLTPLDWWGFVKSLSSPLNVDELVDEVALIFLPRELHPDQHSALKESLLQGLPNLEWTRQCADYLSNPRIVSITRPVEERLRRLFTAIFGMAEFQLQ